MVMYGLTCALDHTHTHTVEGVLLLKYFPRELFEEMFHSCNKQNKQTHLLEYAFTIKSVSCLLKQIQILDYIHMSY